MHIEIFRGEAQETAQNWYWHFKNKGRITADGEAHPTKANAMRAAKGVVRAVLKEVGTKPVFEAVTPKDNYFTLHWG